MLPGGEIAEIMASNEAANQAPPILENLLAQIAPTPAVPTGPKAMTNAWAEQASNAPNQQALLNSLGLKNPTDIAALLQSIQPETLALLQQTQMQQQQQPQQSAQPPYGMDNGYGGQQGYGGDDQYWDNSGPSGNGGNQWGGGGGGDDWNDGGGYGGRGRGRGRGMGRGRGRGGFSSKKLCNFWAKG